MADDTFDRAQASYDAMRPGDDPPNECQRCGDDIEPPDNPLDDWLCDDCRFNYGPDKEADTDENTEDFSEENC